MNASQWIKLRPEEQQQPGTVNGHGRHAIAIPVEFVPTITTFTSIEPPDVPREQWPRDLLEAYARPRGPYTVENAEVLLDETSVELYNGWLVEQEMTSPRERRVVATIQSMLDVSARKVGFGQMLPDQLECLLTDGSVIKPDCSLVSWQRLDKDVITTGTGEHQVLVRCPELVVESRSPSNWRAQEKRKRELYFAHHTQIVWDVDEENQEIWAWYAHSPDEALHFTRTDEIHCEPILPHWRRRVADIFAEHASAEAVVGEVVEIWRAEGEQKRAFQIARSLLVEGMDSALVARVTGLTQGEVERLRDQESGDQETERSAT